jgi:hypothetical protein
MILKCISDISKVRYYIWLTGLIGNTFIIGACPQESSQATQSCLWIFLLGLPHHGNNGILLPFIVDLQRKEFFGITDLCLNINRCCTFWHDVHLPVWQKPNLSTHASNSILNIFRHIFRHSRASQLCWNLSIHPKFQLTSEKVLCVSWCSLCVKSVFACDSANVC